MQPRTPTRAILPTLSAIVTVAGLAAAVVLMAAAVAPAQETAPPEDYGMVKMGESLFRAYCRSCHGPTAEGDGPLAESLRVEPANLTLIAQRNGGEFPFAQVATKIDGTEKVHGHGPSDMPVWGEVFTKVGDDAGGEGVHDKVLALAHYLRSIQVSEASSGGR